MSPMPHLTPQQVVETLERMIEDGKADHYWASNRLAAVETDVFTAAQLREAESIVRACAALTAALAAYQREQKRLWLEERGTAAIPLVFDPGWRIVAAVGREDDWRAIERHLGVELSSPEARFNTADEARDAAAAALGYQEVRG